MIFFFILLCYRSIHSPVGYHVIPWAASSTSPEFNPLDTLQ